MKDVSDVRWFWEAGHDDVRLESDLARRPQDLQFNKVKRLG
jgi:hypothetical protein